MAVSEFLGPDRALIEKTLKVLDAIGKRDARALDSTPTKNLSTRLQMIPSDDAILAAQVLTLKLRLATALAETR